MLTMCKYVIMFNPTSTLSLMPHRRTIRQLSVYQLAPEELPKSEPLRLAPASGQVVAKAMPEERRNYTGDTATTSSSMSRCASSSRQSRQSV